MDPKQAWHWVQSRLGSGYISGLVMGPPHRESGDHSFGDRKSGARKPLFSSKSHMAARAVTGVCAEKESHKLFYAKKLCRIPRTLYAMWPKICHEYNIKILTKKYY